MSTLFSDTFSRADGLLTTPWQQGYFFDAFGGAMNSLTIVSNKVQVTGTALDGAATVDRPLANDQWAQLTITVISAVDSNAPRTLLRTNAPGNLESYQFMAASAPVGDTTRIAKTIASVYTKLANETATTWVAGDVIYSTAIGTALKIYRNGSLLLSTTDASLASGRAGMLLYAIGNVTRCEVDDFSMGDFTPDPSVEARLNGSAGLIRPRPFAPGLAR